MKKLFVSLAIVGLLGIAGGAGAAEKGVYSVTIPEITIHYVIDPSLMPLECGDAPGCVVWTNYDGVRTENLWILARRTLIGIEAKDWPVMEHEIQHIVNRTDSKFANPDHRVKTRSGTTY